MKNNIIYNPNIAKIKHLVYVFLKPLISVCRKKKVEYLAVQAEKHYNEIIVNIKNSGRKKLNFAAYVIFDSTFGMDIGFKRMMDDDHWNPMIVVIPDISRGMEHAKRTYEQTKRYFVNRYGKEYVLDGWDMRNNEYFDHLDKFDIVYYANPYDSMVNKYHKIEYAAKKNVLPIYISYGYDTCTTTTKSRFKGTELNVVWKCFTDTVYSYEDFVNYQINKGKNVVLAGYSKMDAFVPQKRPKNKRLRILISPHHTVAMRELPLSNFLEYYDFILRLPDLFPNVEFVFRPHPLLFTTLINNKIWTEKQVDKYLENIKRKGIIYSVGGEYLKVFSECDALINDCGSFTIEWLYTGKPGCFVYNSKLNPKLLTNLMNKCIERYEIARCEKDIIAFIKSLLVKPIEDEYYMDEWVRENIAINYPDVTSVILQEIDILR